jgi:hypothetical protein
MIVLLTTADTEVLATVRAAELAVAPHRIKLRCFGDRVGAPLRPHHHPDHNATQHHAHHAGIHL